jgi:hypothetical protein
MVLLATAVLAAAGLLGGEEAHRAAVGLESASASSILSDTSGAIEEVVLQFSRPAAEETLPTFESFLLQLPRETVVHVVCESEDDVTFFREQLVRWGVPNRRRVRVKSVDMDITPWARDRFVVTASKDSERWRTIVLPALPPDESPDRLNDAQIPLVIEASRGEFPGTRQSQLFFEGGNMVTCETALFTGYSTLMGPGVGSEQEAIRLLRAEFGKDVVVVGTPDCPEPLEHVDMYLTPLDDHVVLLGDPVWGGRLAGGAGVPISRSHHRASGAGTDPEGEPSCVYESITTPRALRWWELVECQVRKAGFAVERIPLAQDRTGNLITYNNVLMETRGETRIVYMPTYGIPKLDLAAMRTYRDRGFEVRPIDVSETYALGGTIRCLTNVLARRGAPQRGSRLPAPAPASPFRGAGRT